jgi:hypothetical protein
LYQLGLLALAHSDSSQARGLLAESARLFEQQGERAMFAQVQDALAQAELRDD